MSMFMNALGGTPGAAWTTAMRLSACAVVMFENAVMRLVNALAGVVGDDWTTAIRELAWSVVSGAAKPTDGRRKKLNTISVLFMGLR